MNYDGRAWSQPVRIGPPATYEVSCPTTHFCAAVGANGLAGAPSTIATLEHGTWSSSEASTTGAALDRRQRRSGMATPEASHLRLLPGTVTRATEERHGQADLRGECVP